MNTLKLALQQINKFENYKIIGLSFESKYKDEKLHDSEIVIVKPKIYLCNESEKICLQFDARKTTRGRLCFIVSEIKFNISEKTNNFTSFNEIFRKVKYQGFSGYEDLIFELENSSFAICVNPRYSKEKIIYRKVEKY